MKRSKLIFCAVSAASVLAVAITLSSASLAADVAAEPAPYDWTGFYIGAHAGYGSADGDQSFPLVGNFDTEGNGFVGGGQLGANWQIDQIVLGVEGDISFADMSDTVTNGAISRRQDVDMLASVRGRAGFAFDRALIYGTAGWGMADAERKRLNGSGGSDSQTHDGWVYGGGVEWAVTDMVSVRAEYLRYDLDKQEYSLVGPDPIVEIDVDVFRLGLNLNF